MDVFSPAVISSKAAKKDYQNIVGNYADLMKSLSSHQALLQQKNEQRAAAQQATLSMQGEMDQAKMAASSQDFKTALDFSVKQAEIDVKRAALTL